ncbi:hypothetical protein DFH06DRAFT_990579 [Mycena polygramma]|nr:hypothetical protein DFH06DRAFT_990579 [Mycena polygramma]
MAPTPLSELPDAAVDFDEHGRSMWDILLEAEEVMALEVRSSKLKSLLVGVRVVGHFLVQFWAARGNHLTGGANPYRTFINEFVACEALVSTTAPHAEKVKCYTKLSDLGIHYQKHLMRVFRSHGGSLPSTSEHPSRPDMNALMQDTVSSIKRPVRFLYLVLRYPQTAFQALARDSFRCVVSGSIDKASYIVFPNNFPGPVRTCLTQCCHIFSESAQDGTAKEEYAAGAMAILKMFNFDITMLLGNPNTFRNVVTIDAEIHTEWDNLEWWFEETNQPNTYNIVAAHPVFWTLSASPRQQVTLAIDPTFATECAKNHIMPHLPSRELLAIRAMVSRVAHMSGAAEQFDVVMQEREMCTVMAHDGGSSEFLSALMQISAAAQSSTLDSTVLRNGLF